MPNPTKNPRRSRRAFGARQAALLHRTSRVLLGLIVMAAGCTDTNEYSGPAPPQEKGEHPVEKNFATSQPDKIPAIDAAAPLRTETATFALG
jgi:hypothetical protein